MQRAGGMLRRDNTIAKGSVPLQGHPEVETATPKRMIVISDRYGPAPVSNHEIDRKLRSSDISN
jgi:hypothetical protein